MSTHQQQRRISSQCRFWIVIILALTALLFEGRRQGRSSQVTLLPSFDEMSTSAAKLSSFVSSGNTSSQENNSSTSSQILKNASHGVVNAELIDANSKGGGSHSGTANQTGVVVTATKASGTETVAPTQFIQVGVTNMNTKSSTTSAGLPPDDEESQGSTPVSVDLRVHVDANVSQTNQTISLIETGESSSNIGPQGTGLSSDERLDHPRAEAQENTTTVVNITDDGKPFRFCSKVSFPIPNQDTNSTNEFRMEYQCNGTEYDDFESVFQHFVRNSSHNHQHHPTTWGRRPNPLPDHTNVLFMGNSHTRQTFTNLICMYSDQIVHGPNNPLDRVTAYQFGNNSTAYLVFNSPAEASNNWTLRLEMLVQRPLHSFDAFILGQFNKATKEIEKTSFYKEMMNQSLYDPDMAFGKVEPPDIIGVANVFPKPIVFVSNFDIGREKMAKSIIRTIDVIQNQSGRSNIQGIESRKYVPYLNDQECGTNDHFTVGKCEQRKTAHRCSSPKGGHPSLIAWDIQEALFQMLVGNQ